MLISRVPEEDNGTKEGRTSNEATIDHSHEYQTASELLDMMASNLNFDSNGKPNILPLLKYNCSEIIDSPECNSNTPESVDTSTEVKSTEEKVIDMKRDDDEEHYVDGEKKHFENNMKQDNDHEYFNVDEEEKHFENNTKRDYGQEYYNVDEEKNHFENNDTTTCSKANHYQSVSNDAEAGPSDDLFLPSDSRYRGLNFYNHGNRFKRYKDGAESAFNILPIVPTDEQCTTAQSMNMTSLPEEVPEDGSSCYNKKRSPTRNRIKSPYENKSHLIDEKKRRKLLEVRQRREKNKLALSVNGCIVNKRKYPIPPQTANSVTKLSITNKSFYNSIYGQNMEPKPCKMKLRKENKDSIPEISSDVDSPENRDNQKYINKSYYLDNAVTEMMYLDMKNNETQDNFSETSSLNDVKFNFKLLSHLVTPSVIEVTEPAERDEIDPRYINEDNKHDDNIEENNALIPNLKHANTPNNSPLSTFATTSEKGLDEKDTKNSGTTEFRKSIDKIYELIKKLGKSEGNETKLCKSKFTAVAERANYNEGVGETSTVQCSDSGTSVKHQLTSSNASCFSFEKTSNFEETPRTKSTKKETPSVPASKIIISAKSHNTRLEGDKPKKDRKVGSPSSRQNSAENPLKAISQFLHEIDNVQKNRNKAITEKGSKKPEVTFADTKVENRVTVKRNQPRMENRTEQLVEKGPRVVPRDRRNKTPLITQPPIATENRPGSKTLKKKIVDIVDEMKEARGEAVRGPSKLNARLNSLAQPRKIYIQAQIEEFQARYGKSIVTDRLQKLNGSQTGQGIDPPRSASMRYRRKRSPVAVTPKQSSNSQPAVLEKPVKKSSNSNKCDTIPVPNDQSLKQSTTNILKKKMAVLEPPENPSVAFTAKELDGNKSRVPFIPNEIELSSVVSSVEESSTIKNKIREMIDVLIPSPPITIKQNVETKSQEINVNLREDNINEIFCEKCQTRKQTDNEAKKQNHDRPLKIKRDHIIGDTIPEENDMPHENEELQSSDLENAICLTMSMGTFQKRLRHTNFTLTPKQSMQQVFLLQSGDSSSVILQSTISQSFKITNSISDFKCLPELNNIDFGFSPFPMQTPIVGYSFTKYNNQKPHSKQRVNVNSKQDTIKQSHPSTTNIEETNVSSDISVQCYKGGSVEQFPKPDVGVATYISSPENNSNIIEEKPTESEADSNKANDVNETKQVNENLQSTRANEATNELKEPIAASEGFKSQEYPNSSSEGYLNKISEESDDNVSKECVSALSTKRSIMGDGYTASLDVLVGLLTEIQTITTCQSQMANADADDTEVQDTFEDVQAILQSATALENVEQEARNIISITSLDKLRQLESNASILSFYLSNNGRNDASDNNFANLNIRPLCADKEVSAVISTEFNNKCTDVPSRFFPLTVNHSTNVTSSLIGLLSEPSNHSMLTYNEHSLHSDTSLTSLKKLRVLKVSKKEREVDNILPVVVFKHRQIDDDYNRKVHKKVTTLKTEKQKFVICKKTLKNKYASESDFDPIMKMKRDILVTMYSVLVFTVFAALSFPEILYRA